MTPNLNMKKKNSNRLLKTAKTGTIRNSKSKGSLDLVITTIKRTINNKVLLSYKVLIFNK